ncbi:hypothetical protein STENM223S_08797 [Streptomyces tendae]
MKRTTLSLIACATALAAVTGFAAVSAPDGSGTDTAAPAARLPVERTSLLCPAPSTSDLAETAYTSFTPVTKGADEKGGAALAAAEPGRRPRGRRGPTTSPGRRGCSGRSAGRFTPRHGGVTPWPVVAARSRVRYRPTS